MTLRVAWYHIVSNNLRRLFVCIDVSTKHVVNKCKLVDIFLKDRHSMEILAGQFIELFPAACCNVSFSSSLQINDHR